MISFSPRKVLTKNIWLKILLGLCVAITTQATAWAQERTVTGTVLDENQEPLPGASILIKDTNQGTISSLEGKFKLSIPNDDAILVLSSIGYTSKNIIVGSQTNLNIQMEVDTRKLNEVVVIGYGTQKVKDLTGSAGLLSADDTKMQPVQRMEDMLQGKMAGVVITQGSGAPGSAPKVNIRGFTGDPVYVIDGFIGADINALNPNDIESISVLKDASATAIYGSRGANGVVLITTKRSKGNQPLSVNFSYDHRISEVARKLDLLGPVDYMRKVNEKNSLNEESDTFSEEDINKMATSGEGTDWQDEIFRVAHSNIYNLSVGKGWEKSDLRVSLGANQSAGIIRNTDYERYTGRLNFNTSLTSNTKFTLNILGTLEKPHNVSQGNRNSGLNEAVNAATIWAPNLPVYDAEGNYTNNSDYSYGSTTLGNPLYLTDGKNRNIENQTFGGNITIEQKIFEGLTAKTFIGYQKRDAFSSTFLTQNEAFNQAHSQKLDIDTDAQKFQGNIQLNYQKELGESHSLNATMVVEALRTEQESFYLGYLYENGEDQAPTIDDTTPPLYTPEGMLSYLGRVNYSFKDKLLATGSIRVDGSSRLHPGNRWGTFLSGALAYRLSEESFIKDIDLIEDLKLRVSYGETGNVNSVKAFQIQDLIKDMNGYSYVGDKDVYDIAKGVEDGEARANPYLLWETSQQFNAGFDVSLWDGMLSLTTDYYIKYSNDNHFDEEVASYLGGGSVKTNIGQFLNKGVEVQLATRWTDGDNFKFNASLNLACNQSEILNLPQDTVYVGGTPFSGFKQQSHVLIEGQPVGQLYGYKYLGVNPENGKIIQQGVDPENLNADDMVVIGQGHPDFTWGFNANVSYKDFSLSMFLQGVHGMDVFNMSKFYAYGGGSGNNNVTSTLGLDAWSPENTTSSIPSINADFQPQSSLFVEDASFVKLRNVTFAYDAPEAILQKVGLKSFRAYVSGQNLLTFTDYTGFDPEAGSGTNLAPGIDRGSYPTPRTYVLGVKIGI